MARKVIVHLLDDLDGETQAVETVRLVFDGKDVELDLNAENVAALRQFLKPYLEAGRRTGRQQSRLSVVPDYDRAAVRRWAAENGHEVPARGRIPQRVVDAYTAAGGRS